MSAPEPMTDDMQTETQSRGSLKRMVRRPVARCEYCHRPLKIRAKPGWTYACGPCGSQTIKYDP